VFGAAPSWSDEKLEAGGIPNTPLVPWYVNWVLSSILFSLKNILSLIIGNLVTTYLCT
jgi:hypothetical protein